MYSGLMHAGGLDAAAAAARKGRGLGQGRRCWWHAQLVPVGLCLAACCVHDAVPASSAAAAATRR